MEPPRRNAAANASQKDSLVPTFRSARESVCARILLTRPRAQSEALGERLRLLGFEPVIAPMLTIRFQPAPAEIFERYTTLLLTSANGVRALAQSSARRDLHLFVVGEATARVARALSFANVTVAGGTAESLGKMVHESTAPAAGPLLRVRGREERFDLARWLRARGFTVEERILYSAEPVRALPAGVTACLRERAPDAAMFFSPRSAALFAVLRDWRKGGMLARTAAIAISAATVEALSPAGFARCILASRPDETAMIAALRRAVG